MSNVRNLFAIKKRPIRVQLGEHAQLPKRHYEDDTGFDLYVAEDFVVGAREFALVPTAIRVQMPPRMWYLILGRSSASNRLGLIVIPAVIDASFRGVLYANVYNPGATPVAVKAGDRVAQMVPFELLSDRLYPVKVNMLDTTERGDNGFGSTGGLVGNGHANEK